MSRFLILSLLFLVSCSDSLRVNRDVMKHGAVPEVNPVREESIIIDKESNYAFWVVYIPILSVMGFLTWKTFKKEKK